LVKFTGILWRHNRSENFGARSLDEARAYPEPNGQKQG
jgi:hypothetical protein